MNFKDGHSLCSNTLMELHSLHVVIIWVANRQLSSLPLLLIKLFYSYRRESRLNWWTFEVKE